MSEPTPETPAVEIRNARVRLGETEVLRGVSLRIPQGKMVALIGPNGSGKTTLLRCLLGLQRLDAGEIRLLGEDIGPRSLKRVGYVPQRLQLEPAFTLSVREFLALRRPDTRHWFWQRQQTIDARLHGTLSDLDVESVLDRPLAGLSGGQLQRVLIAHSLLGQPDLLLLDEPTAGVDTPGEHSFYELISSIHQRLGITVVLVSHDLAMVFRHASWVFALNGVICCQGHPEEVLNADSLKAAYGIHVTPYHHHHSATDIREEPIRFHKR